MIVSDGTDLTAMSPWRVTPIHRPAEFAPGVEGPAVPGGAEHPVGCRPSSGAYLATAWPPIPEDPICRCVGYRQKHRPDLVS